MKNNCSDDINKLIEIPDLIVKSIEIEEGKVIINGECVEETQCPHCSHERLKRYKGKDKEIRRCLR